MSLRFSVLLTVAVASATFAMVPFVGASPSTTMSVAQSPSKATPKTVVAIETRFDEKTPPAAVKTHPPIIETHFDDLSPSVKSPKSSQEASTTTRAPWMTIETRFDETTQSHLKKPNAAWAVTIETQFDDAPSVKSPKSLSKTKPLPAPSSTIETRFDETTPSAAPQKPPAIETTFGE